MTCTTNRRKGAECECENNQTDGRVQHSFGEGMPSNEPLCRNIEEEMGKGAYPYTSWITWAK